MAKTPPLDRFGPRLDAEGWATVGKWSSWAKRFAHRLRDRDMAGGDMLADIAVDALIEAVATHDPSRSSLKTWANCLVKWRVVESCCGTKGHKRFRWESNHTALRDKILNELITFDPELNDDTLVDHLLGSLPPREAAIFREHVIDGDSGKDVAARHGMSKQNVCKLVRTWRSILAADRSALAATEDWRRTIPA